LRIRFAQTTLAPDAKDIEGRGKVKGVYPYLADNGAAVYVDFLMVEPGRLQMQPAKYGYRVNIFAGAGAASIKGAGKPPQTAAGTNALEEITYTKLPGDRLQINLKMSSSPEIPSAFTINQPPRIALDFTNTRISMAKKSVRIGYGAVASVTAVEAENRSRVVLSLVKSTAYTMNIKDKDIVLIVENPIGAIAGAETPKTTRFASAAKPGRYSLKNIDFRRGPAGDGKVIIDLSDPGVGINIYEQAGEIMVDFLDTSTSQDMQRRLDVVDFATPIQTIDTFVQGKNVRMVIKPKGLYEHLAYQAGNIFTVNVKPVVARPEDEKKVDEFGYSGEKMSLNFQNIDVRAALQVIADFTSLNFVTSDTVKGNLTLRLKDVPWDQALDIIVASKNLAIRRKGNVITVAPADEVAAREKLALEATKQVLELEPLVSELIQINYAKAEDIAALLKSVKAVAGNVAANAAPFSSVSYGGKQETESNTLLSPRGQVTVDTRTNSLLIQDTPGKVRDVRKLIAALDRPVRQVMIETRLVEATDNFSRNLGVRFGTSNSYNASGVGITQGASLDPITGSLVNGLNVNLPSTGAGTSPAGTLALTIVRLGSGNLLNLELSALETEGKGKIISSPRLITANQKKARIEQGQEQIFPLGLGRSETKKAVLSLDVTPQITPDDRVIMDVEITKDNFVDAASPRINTKRITTQVLLDNGETVVIGGVFEQDEAKTVTQVPFFGDLPLLGWLFKNKAVRDNKTELLIFLTPRILSQSLTLR
jgi:type IV pilus assembly protein PilQ